MDLYTTYKNIQHGASKQDIDNALRSIVNAPPYALSPPERDKLVQLLLDDIREGLSGSKGRVSRKDLGLVLLTLKTLGRAAKASEIIVSSENLTILSNAASTLRSFDSEAADDALRCVANALLLVESGRSTWVSINGATHCVDLLEKSTSPTVIFLCCRILFLCTASPSSELLSILLDNPSSSSKIIPHDIIDTIAKQLNRLLGSIADGLPMSKEAMTDLLKFTFNIGCHWPRIASDADDVHEQDDGPSANPSQPALGERWTKRLDGLLPPLRRVFINLPPTSPSPLSPPMTHILHALLPIPYIPRLQPYWFADSNDSGEASDKHQWGWKALWDSLPPRGNHANSPTQEPSSQASSPGASTKGKEKEKDPDGRGALDRALLMLSPRRSLSSRSSSPVSTQAPKDLNRDPSRPPEILVRAVDLLDASLAYYLPDNIDPDDSSVKQLCAQEDVQLDHVMAPLVLLLTRLCKNNIECRKIVRNKILPVDLDRTSPLEQRADTLGRFIRLMGCVHHPQLKDAVGGLLFVICDSDGEILSSQIGYGNAAGFLFNKGMLPAPPQGPTSGADSASAEINPITGMVQRQRPPAIEMTDEEKEREAEKLFVLFDRLEKAGGMENPIKKALHEGRLEKYSNMKKDDSDNDLD